MSPHIATEHHPLQPFLPPQATLLMLGSFPPPPARWCMNFFYPNRSNMMWEVMGLLLTGSADTFVDNEHRTFRQELIEATLQHCGIALYDTATEVRRLRGNASDKFLEIVRPTDIAHLLDQLPNCHHLLCTGQKSAETLCSRYGVQPPPVDGSVAFSIGSRPVTLHRAPSTSRAYPMPVAEKARHYAPILQQAGIEVHPAPA